MPGRGRRGRGSEGDRRDGDTAGRGGLGQPGDRAREADLGVASGNGKGQIFVRGQVIATVPESAIVETLIEEAMRLAEQGGTAAGDDEAGPGRPVVTAY